MIRHRFWTITAIIPIAASLAGCASDAALRAPLVRDPGPAPAYLAPVKVADPRRGESPVVDAARQAAGVVVANAIIGCVRDDWDKMRAAMVKGEQAPAEGAMVSAECAAAEQARKPAPVPKKRRWLGG